MKHYDVLIVDDEEHSAAMLANQLELRGFSCKVRNDTALPSTLSDIYLFRGLFWICDCRTSMDRKKQSITGGMNGL